MSVYFGGSRHAVQTPIIGQIVRAVLAENQPVHVGCQWGADHQVVNVAVHFAPSFLVVFAVAPMRGLPVHVAQAGKLGARVVPLAGGAETHIKARYLLRSKTAFRGCSQAVFFEPGAGSLAVARECINANIPVFAFSETQPAAIPSTAGAWRTAKYKNVSCWQFAPAQQFGLF